jgi:hypothetical protein
MPIVRYRKRSLDDLSRTSTEAHKFGWLQGFWQQGVITRNPAQYAAVDKNNFTTNTRRSIIQVATKCLPLVMDAEKTARFRVR